MNKRAVLIVYDPEPDEYEIVDILADNMPGNYETDLKLTEWLAESFPMLTRKTCPDALVETMKTLHGEQGEGE